MSRLALHVGHALRISALPLALAATFTHGAAVARSGDLLIHDAYVMTMDDKLGDFANGDVLIRDGRIVAVGDDLTERAGTAQRLDARGRLILPGFVDTHSHLYVTTMRGQFRNAQGKFFPVSAKLAASMTPDDVHVAMHTGALELLSGGITTTGDFFDNVLTPAHADAGLRALQEAGIRAVMYYGGPDKTTRKPIDMTHLRALSAQLPADSLVRLGLAWRLPRQLDDPANWAMRHEEYRAARALGLPIQVHVSGQPGPMFDALVERDYLASGVTVVHGTDATPRHLKALEDAGASLSLTPISEHRVGFGVTRLDQFAGATRQGLGIDGNALAGSADMFATMRLAALTWSGGVRDEGAPDPRELLALATRRGAEVLGMATETGTLTPGKRADLQIIDLSGLHLSGFGGGDPAALVVYSARPGDVETVLVNGQLVKADHRLVGVDEAAVARRANESARRLLANTLGKTPSPSSPR